MAIDMKKMRSKLTQLKSRGSGGGNFWKPQDGNQTIRILPTEDEDPFKQFFFHYNVGEGGGFLCPKHNFGDNCPVCGFVKTLYQQGDDESKEVARGLNVKSRFFSPVLVRGEDDSGVRVYGYSKTVYETLLGLVLNPEYGDITDLETGVDLGLQYGKPPGGNFPVTKITPKRQSSSLCDKLSDDQCKEMLESIPDFSTLFERRSSEDVQKLLDEHMAGNNAEGFSRETEKYTDTEKVDSAFNELL